MAYSWTETIEEGTDIEVVDIDELRTVTDMIEDGCYADYIAENADHDSGHDATHYSTDDAAAFSSHDGSHYSGDNSSHDSGHDATAYATHKSNHDVTRKATHYVANKSARYTRYYSGFKSGNQVADQSANTGGEA
jgi:hypothetical protein